MVDNPHQVTLRRLIEAHEAELSVLQARADRLRVALRRPQLSVEGKRRTQRKGLHDLLSRVEESIAKHEALIALAGDERIAELLHAVTDDPDLARQAAADPRAFVATHGVQLPESIVIEPLIIGGETSARISSVDPDTPFLVTWTRFGFQVPAQAGLAGNGGAPDTHPRPSRRKPSKARRPSQ